MLINGAADPAPQRPPRALVLRSANQRLSPHIEDR
jgi:hypothetical protein